MHAIASRLYTQVRRLIEPRALPRPGGLVARFAAVELLARSEKRLREAVGSAATFRRRLELAHLIEMKSAVAPAQTTATVATWATELVAEAVQDVADNLPETALAQLRRLATLPACHAIRRCHRALSFSKASRSRSARC